MPEDPRKTLYSQVTSLGWNIGTPEEFEKKMLNEESRKRFYETLSNPSAFGKEAPAVDLGDFNTFEAKMIGRYDYDKGKVKDAPEVFNTWDLIKLGISTSPTDPTGDKTKALLNLSGGATTTLTGVVHGIYQFGALTYADPLLGLKSIGTSLLDLMSMDYSETEPIRKAFEEDLAEEEKAGDLKPYKNLLEIQSKWNKSINDAMAIPWVKDSFLNSTLPAALGSSIGFMAVGMLAPNPASATFLSGFAGALSEGSLLSVEAFDTTGDPKKSVQAFGPGLLLGATEAVPVGNWVSRLKFGKASLGVLANSKNPALKLLGNQLVEGFEEGIQETFQQVGENYTAKELWDATRELSQGVLEGGAAGFISGFMMAGMSHALVKTPADEKREVREELARAYKNINAGLQPTADAIYGFKSNITTKTLDENLISLFGKDSESIKEKVMQSPEFLDLKKTIDDNQQALNELYDKNPGVFIPAIVDNVMTKLLEVSSEAQQTATQSKAKTEKIETQLKEEVINQPSNVIKSEVNEATEEEIKPYDDELYFQEDRGKLLEATKKEIAPTNVEKTVEAVANWRVQKVTQNQNFPNYSKAKEQSFTNYLKKYLPAYQINFFMERIKETGKDTLTKEELAQLAEDTFAYKYKIYYDANKSYSQYGSITSDQDTYHAMHFGYPGSVETVERYLDNASEYVKDIDGYYEAKEEATVRRVPGYQKRTLSNEAKSYIKLWKDLGYKIYDNKRNDFGAITSYYGVDPITKLINSEIFDRDIALMNSPSNPFNDLSLSNTMSFLREAIINPLQLFDSMAYGWQKLRAIDILEGKRTAEQFTPFTLFLSSSEVSDIEYIINEKLGQDEELNKLDAESFIEDDKGNIHRNQEARDLYEKKFSEKKAALQNEIMDKALEDQKKAYKGADALLAEMFKRDKRDALVFEEIIDYMIYNNPLLADILFKVKADFKITGSMALSAFGTVYREEIDLHDLDLIGDVKKFKEIFAGKFAIGEAMLLRQIKDGNRSVNTFAFVPKGYKIGKILGEHYVINDADGNIDTKIQPTVVDIFDDERGPYEAVKKGTYTLVDPRNTFAAKLDFGRLKDIQDLFKYLVTDLRFLNKVKEYYSETSLSSHHFSNMKGTFGWIRGDIKNGIARIFEIQSDYFKHGASAPTGVEKEAEIFLKGIEEFGYAKFALLSAMGEYSKQGINKVRLPIKQTVNYIEGFQRNNPGKRAEDVKKFYDITVSNIAKKLFGDSVQEVTDEDGLEWLEITINENQNPNEKILFEESNIAPTPDININSHKYSEVLTDEMSGKTAKEIFAKLESEGLMDEKIKPIVDWMIGKFGDTPIYLGNDSTKVGTDKRTNKPITLKNKKAAYRIDRDSKKDHIVINKDAIADNPYAIYHTLAHEVFHKATVEQLSTNMRFRLEVESLMKEVKENMIADGVWDDSYDSIFEADGKLNPAEFLAHIIGNTSSGLRDYVYNTKIPGKPKWIQRLLDIIRKLWKNQLGETPSKYSDALEIILHQHIGTPTTFQRMPSSEFSPIYDVTASDLQEATDKLFLITEGSYEDPKVIKTVTEMIAQQIGQDINDPVAYMQSITMEQLKGFLKNSQDWINKATFHYNEYYKDVFDTFEEYEDAITRQVYNQAKNLVKVKKVRVVKTTEKSYQNLEGETNFSIEELGFYYKDKNNASKTSYIPKMKILELVPKIEQMLGVKLEIFVGEELKEVEIFRKAQDKDPDISESWSSISEYSELAPNENTGEMEPVQNQRLSYELERAGYFYLGNWSDKKTVVLLRPAANEEQKRSYRKKLDAINKMYAEKAHNLVITILKSAYKAQGLNAEIEFEKLEAKRQQRQAKEKQAVSLSEMIAELTLPEGFPTGSDLAHYGGEALSHTEVLRGVFEDLRLGGQIVDGVLQSALFNENSSDTFDAIKLFKRPYLVAPMSYVHQDSKEIRQLLKDLGLEHEKYGFVVKNGKLYVRAFIYNGEPAPGTTVTYKDKEYDLNKLLVNDMGIARTDGRLQFVLGAFDKVWRKLHGATKTGALKFWIGNNFDNEFTNPLFVKGAGHGNNDAEITSQWMLNNNIGLLISSTAAKINGYGKGVLFQEKPNTFLIPFENIYRDKEKGQAEKDAKGLSQSLLANWLTKINPAYPTPEGTKDTIAIMLDKFVNKLTDRFVQDMMSLDAIGIIDFFKQKSLTATSNYEKTVSSIILDLVLTETDVEYKKLKDFLASKPELSEEEKMRANQALKEYKVKNLRLSQEKADKILNIFHEPFFVEALKSKLKKDIEKATHFQTPSVWGTMDYDGGNLMPERIKQVEKWAVKEYKKRNLSKFFKEKQDEYAKVSKAISILQAENVNIAGAIEGAKDQLLAAELVKRQEEIRKEIDDYGKVIEKYDENGRYLVSKEDALDDIKPTPEALKEIMDEVLDENGFLKRGNLMVSEDIANYLKMDLGDIGINGVVPSDSLMSLGGFRLVASLPPSVAESGKIIGNSEDFQGIRGKDFDIDTMFLFTASEMFTKKEIEDFAKALDVSLENHQRLITNEYRKVLKDEVFNINGKRVYGDRLSFNDTLEKSVRLKYVQYFNGERNGRKFYNPVKDAHRVLNEYNKDIGKIVNRRKLVTLKSQIGFKTRFRIPEKPNKNEIVITPNHKKKFSTYNLLLDQTNDMVDVPTNTNKFFYQYDPVTSYNQDNGTNFDPNNKTDKFIVKTLTQVEDFLFKFAARLTTDYNLEDVDGVREFEDELKYIAVQKQINELILSGNKAELYRLFKESYDEKQYEIRPFALERNAFRLLNQLRKALPSGEYKRKFSNWINQAKQEPSLSIAFAKHFLANQNTIPGLADFKREHPEYVAELEAIVDDYEATYHNYISKISSRSLALSVAKDYIDNMEIENINGSPIMNVINKIDLSAIPAITMDVEHYTATHTLAVASMLNRPQWKTLKDAFLKAYQTYQGKFILKNPPLMKTDLLGQTLNNNQIALSLHYMTGENLELHYLKAKVIALVNPVIQKTTHPKLAHGAFYSDIYQKANEYAYPRLFKILLENNKTIDFTAMDTVEVKTPFGKLKIGPGVNNVLTFNFTDKKVIYTADTLLNDNSVMAKEVRDYFFGEFLRDAQNRIALSKILAIGGIQTPVDQRIEEAAKLVKNDLYKFGAKDRFLFWMSLYGRPNAMASPVNLTINKGKQFGQDRMFQLIGLVKDAQAINIMKAYAEEFNSNYVGPTFNESIEIENLLVRPDVFNTDDNVEVYFEDAMPQVQEEKDTFADDVKTIYKLISDETLETIDKDKLVASILDIVTGEQKQLNPIDVINSISAYVTRENAPINQTMIAFAKAQSFQESVNTFASIQEIQNSTIANLLDQMKAIIEDRNKNSTRKERKLLMAKEYEELNKQREENPYKLQMVKGIGGYDIIFQGDKYPDSEKTIAILIDRLNITDPVKALRLRIQIEFMKRYHVDNVNAMNNMIAYIKETINTLPNDFARIKELHSMLRKYEDLLKRMNTFDFNYFPRVYRKADWEKIADKMHRKEVEDRVRELADSETKKKLAGKKFFIEPYASLTTEELIKDQIEKEIVTERKNIVRNSFKNYVHTWEMRRQVPKEHEGYIKDSFIGDRRHFRQFRDMLLADGMYINYLQYEYGSAIKGVSKDHIRKVKRWFGMVANHKMLRGKYKRLSSVKIGDRIRFYYKEKTKTGYKESYIQGEVGSIDANYIQLKMDKEATKRLIQSKIIENRKVHDDIVNLKESDKPATANQKYRLQEFVKQGELESFPKKITKQQANDLIYQTYLNMLNNSENWGRFDRSAIYVKEYEGRNLKEQSGVTVEPKFKASDEFWQTVQALSSGIFLGTPAAGSRNFIDATWGLVRDLRIKRYFKNIIPAFGIKGRFRGAIENKNPSELLEELSAMQRKGFEAVKSDINATNRLVELITYKYALEHGLNQIDSYGNMVLNEEEIESQDKIKSYLDGFSRGIRATTSFLLTPFKSVETTVRMQAAFLYAHKAIMEDGLTNLDEVELAITKGIARTQSLYESMYRRLGEDATLGRFLFQFSQFNGFQLNNKINEYKQAKRLKLKWTDAFKREISVVQPDGTIKTYKAGDTVDPNVMNRMLVDWWIDTIGLSLSVVIPGFRASNPVNRALALPISFIAQMIVSGDLPDDWDLRDWIYGLLGFFTGIGLTIPVQVVANLFYKVGAPIPVLSNTDKELNWFETFVPVNPRLPAFTMTAIAPFIGERSRNQFSESNYRAQQLERLFLGFNFFTPYSRRYMSREQKKFNVQSADAKVLDLLFNEYGGVPAPNLEQLVPIWNMIKDK